MSAPMIEFDSDGTRIGGVLIAGPGLVAEYGDQYMWMPEIEWEEVPSGDGPVTVRRRGGDSIIWFNSPILVGRVTEEDGHFVYRSQR